MLVSGSNIMDVLREMQRRHEAESKARIPMYQEVGRTVLTLSDIEQLMAALYVFLSAPTLEEKSVKKFRTANGIPARLALLDEAVNSSPLVEDKQRWAELSAHIAKHRAVRNLAAHGSIEFHYPAGSEDFKVAIGTQDRDIKRREEAFLLDFKAAADELEAIRHSVQVFLRRLVDAE